MILNLCVSILGVIAALALSFPAGAQPTRVSLSGQAAASEYGPALLKPAQAAVDKGLEFLAKRQTEDGALSAGGNGRNAAVCALAGIAWLSSGSTPDRGPYGREVARVTDFLLEKSQASGLITNAEAQSHGPMYEHGFAVLYLSEVYGMFPREDFRDKLSRSVELIVRSQNDEGGWRYQPRRADADLSVTVCQVMALRAARNAGFRVPNETIDRSVDYVKRCQNADGGFRYVLADTTSAFPRSAAALVALFSAGIYEGPEIERGLTYLDGNLPREAPPMQDGYFMYGHYYAVQAMWQAGGPRWERWFTSIRDVLVNRQQADGSWADPTGVEYGTAMATIILQMPDSSVPIFQR